MKRNDLILNLIAAAAFIVLGFMAGSVYSAKKTVERSIEVMHRQGTDYMPADLTYIATGE